MSDTLNTPQNEEIIRVTKEFRGNIFDGPIIIKSEQELNDDWEKKKEKEKREDEVLGDLSKIMSGFPGYDSVRKYVYNETPCDAIYWAIIRKDNGIYTLERVKCVKNLNRNDYDFYIIDKNGDNQTEKKFGRDDFLGKFLWKKSLLASIKGEKSPSTLSIEERTRSIPPKATGGKSRRHRKNSLRKRKSKKSKKRRHTKRR